MKRIKIIISGNVQGVFFRHNTNKIANRLALKGFVRNLSNGKVEVVAEGDEDKLNELVGFCKKGPVGAHVDNVEVTYEKPKKEFDDFGILGGIFVV